MTVTYQQLDVWKDAMFLAVETYRISNCFPKRETYGLTAQLRKAAVSVPSNVAESQGRFRRGEAIALLLYARGSLYELETQIQLAARLSYLENEEEGRLLEHAARVGRRLNGLIRYVARMREKKK